MRSLLGSLQTSETAPSADAPGGGRLRGPTGGRAAPGRGAPPGPGLRHPRHLPPAGDGAPGSPEAGGSWILRLPRDIRRSPGGDWAPGAVKALVTIMQGCDNFCTYCVVPYVRGREVQPAARRDIVAKSRIFWRPGGKEVTLLGQNVNSYGRGLPEPVTFSRLAPEDRRLAGIGAVAFCHVPPPGPVRGVDRPRSASCPALCEHLHLPVQSGSDRILTSHEPGLYPGQYLQKVTELRRACPGLSLSTDIIVGFPGETEGDFEQTLELMRAAAFDQAFSFKYSPRPQTQAADSAGPGARRGSGRSA